MLDKVIKAKIKKRDGYTCGYCGCKNKLLMTIDHRVAKTRGGSDDEANLVTACFFCNQLKGSKTESEFKKFVKSLVAMKELGHLDVAMTPLGLETKNLNYLGANK